MFPRLAARNITRRLTARHYSEEAGNQSTGGNVSRSSPPSQVNAEVPGLSSACIHQAAQPVGPGVEPNKSGAYKVPEYFCYDNTTYFEAEVEMAKYRCPQPSALRK